MKQQPIQRVVTYRFLNKLEVMCPEVPEILHQVLDCLNLLRLVVECCFSWKLVADFQEKIQAFTQNYSDLMIYGKVFVILYFTILTP